MPKDYTKTNPRVLSSDIYPYIAKNTSLTTSQVKECLEAYAKMVEDLLLSEYIEEDTTISVPKLGSFYIKKREGRKKGTKYPLFERQQKGECKIVELEEDEPTRYKLAFRCGKPLQNKMREKKWQT